MRRCDTCRMKPRGMYDLTRKAINDALYRGDGRKRLERSFRIFEAAMKLYGSRLKGYRISKDGKSVEKIPGYGKDVSAKLRERSSKRVRVVRPGTT